MKVVRRYLAREVALATLLVMAAFLVLFAFFDLIQELGEVGRGRYDLLLAMAYVTMTLPGRVYELMPIAVLIGSLFALATLARHSEVAVLRASGLSVSGLLGALFRVALVFAMATLLIGELVAPPAERAAQALRLAARGEAVGADFRSGVWVKDGNTFINVRQVLPDNRMQGIRVYDFDDKRRLLSIEEAREGEYLPPDGWRLQDVVRTVLTDSVPRVEKFSEVTWHSAVNPDILDVLLVNPERMSLPHLYQYIGHLHDNHQKAERYEIALWKKLVYPLASLVMVALALPFATSNQRFGGVSLRIFVGVMVGVLFHMLNGLSSSLGVINDWSPALAAMAPSLLFLVMAVVLLWWTERR